MTQIGLNEADVASLVHTELLTLGNYTLTHPGGRPVEAGQSDHARRARQGLTEHLVTIGQRRDQRRRRPAEAG